MPKLISLILLFFSVSLFSSIKNEPTVTMIAPDFLIHLSDVELDYTDKKGPIKATTFIYREAPLTVNFKDFIGDVTTLPEKNSLILTHINLDGSKLVLNEQDVIKTLLTFDKIQGRVPLLKIDFQEALLSLNLEYLLLSAIRTGDTILKKTTLSCEGLSNLDLKKISIYQVIKSCLNKTSVKMDQYQKVSSKQSAFDALSLSFYKGIEEAPSQQLIKQQKKSKLENINATLTNGKLKLSAVLDEIIDIKVKIEGTLTTQDTDEKVILHISSAKAGIISIRSLLMKELKKLDAKEGIEVVGNNVIFTLTKIFSPTPTL